MKYVLPFVLIGLLVSCTNKPNTTGSSSNLEQRVDSLVKKDIDSARAAGIAIGVFKGNEKLLLKSYGYADLEHDVKLPVDASFEIGSVTKQFTAVALLLLVEQGKVSLDDDFTKYVKFDTKGRKITVRQLLNHTSGIKGYTEMEVFGRLAKEKHKRDTLLRLVEKEPFDFEPGEALIYNNSAFYIAGLVIEKASGMSYEEYVSKNLFEKNGMTHSYYCNEQKVKKGRAHGYDMEKDGLVRAAYLDHTWPYAAGSLCSTVEDLVKWDDALHHGRVLSEPMYKELLATAVLNDGSPTHYAKGLTIQERNGHAMIEHGGGIFGFLSENRYFPAEDLKIVVLVNTTGPVSPDAIADKITEFIFGKAPAAGNKYSGDLSKYTGVFKGRGRGRDLTATVSKNDSTILIQMRDKPTALKFVKDDTWSDGYTTYTFVGDGLSQLRVDQTYGYYVLKREK